MLMLTEGFDFGLDRWFVSGEVNYLVGAGVRQKNGITIPHANQRLTNYISRQFRPIDSLDEDRTFRLSFWMKIEGTIQKDSEFISITSSREECGVLFGINNQGKLYASRMFFPDIMGTKYTDESSMRSLIDGKYHFIEIYAKYDADWTGAVLIYVDNVLQIKKNGINLEQDHCWSRPDKIKFGNVIGANLSIDDIIVWNDVGTDYVGHRGSMIINSSTLALQQNVLRGVGDYSFAVDNKKSTGAMVTISITGEEASEACVRPVITYDKDVVYGSEKRLITAGPVSLEIPVKPGIENTSVGIQRVK